ncbi:hypothetical protein GUITHDRAFT_153324 [Guillardia theta CCMP2712]|uniref:Uncharacterized protein n=1 Tax=Guillardia theta (strain CCMP2712) TaxID=905079 RepID=L1J5I5_GUITC|nr:hypothetical protein GUITHDRAFT_153324 [Guillardia theta CCMP2712]EKX43335.1 hypothetical protein GUITHDRAFT_153324 [Guillardia theta CCMP2712]|mmetsp:Transcript_29828/g.95399  ORF Transcript_29828/g.95399 Transcript_29828/m.95399 type:complete len:118 (+) Transcript_29828:137-490(+)|eukprot:XP_005830315.1 hypothetical protein GUITHDRAFT_153324 [Guillardia theta CCMP2712]
MLSSQPLPALLLDLLVSEIARPTARAHAWWCMLCRKLRMVFLLSQVFSWTRTCVVLPPPPYRHAHQPCILGCCGEQIPSATVKRDFSDVCERSSRLVSQEFDLAQAVCFGLCYRSKV